MGPPQPAQVGSSTTRLICWALLALFIHIHILPVQVALAVAATADHPSAVFDVTVFAADDHPSAVFDVTVFGAVGDGQTLDTAAIRNATAALKAAGGGELRFPAGRTFLTEPFNLSSHTLLTLGANTTIRAYNASGSNWPLLTVFEVS